MNITILGRHGSGKSNLGDIIGKTLFKMDSDAVIKNNDPDRTNDTLGSGNGVHNINVVAMEDNDPVAYGVGRAMDQDIIVIVLNEKFHEWFRAIEDN